MMVVIQTNPWLKRLILVAVSFHLVAVCIVPSPSSLIMKGLGSILTPYINFVAMNASWQFFSPDPANVMYIEYHIFFEDVDGQEIKETISGFYPKEKIKVGLESVERRFLYSTRFMYLDFSRLEKIFLPWLCRSHPGASRVSLKPYLEKIPQLEVAYLNPEKRSEREIEELQSINFGCSDLQVMAQ